MDARLRKRRGILRVSASRHIDCSVRRRPFGSTPFYAALANSFLAASALQMRPPSGWMRCTPQPYPPAAVLLVRSATLAHHARDAPSSLFRPRSPRPVLAHRAPFRPYPSTSGITHFETSGGKSCTLQQISLPERFKNRHSFGNVRKAATHLKPVRSRAVTIDARLVPLKPLRFKNRHLSADVSQTGDLLSIVHIFKAALAFIFQNSSK